MKSTSEIRKTVMRKIIEWMPENGLTFDGGESLTIYSERKPNEKIWCVFPSGLVLTDNNTCTTLQQLNFDVVVEIHRVMSMDDFSPLSEKDLEDIRGFIGDKLNFHPEYKKYTTHIE